MNKASCLGVQGLIEPVCPAEVSLTTKRELTAQVNKAFPSSFLFEQLSDLSNP